MTAPLSEIVDVQVSIIRSVRARESFNKPLIVDAENVLGSLASTPAVPEIREYASLAEMALDNFKPYHKAYRLADALFAQAKRPKTVKIAGWNSAHTTAAVLTGIEGVDAAWFALLMTTRVEDATTATAIKDAAAWCQTTAERSHMLVYEANRTIDKSASSNVFSELAALVRTKAAGFFHTPRVQRLKLTISQALLASNSITYKINGDLQNATVFAADSDTTLAAIATQLAAHADIESAIVITGGAGTDVDRMIVITAAHYLRNVVLSDFACSGGVSQPTFAVGENDLPIRQLTFSAALVALNSTLVGINGTDTAATVFAVDSDTTMAAIATAIAGLSGVGNAAVILVAAAVTNDRVIEIYGLTPTGKLNVTKAIVTLGASQATCTVAVVDSSPSEPLDAGIVGRCVSADPGSLSWANKSLAVVGTDSLSTTERAAISAAYGNFFATFGDDVNMTRLGVTAEGVTIRNRILVEAMIIRIQAAIVAAEAAEDFIPYTDAGISLIGAAVESVLAKLKLDGWISEYTIDVPLRADVDAGDVSTGVLNDISFTAVSSGEIQTVNIVGTLQQ